MKNGVIAVLLALVVVLAWRPWASGETHRTSAERRVETTPDTRETSRSAEPGTTREPDAPEGDPEPAAENAPSSAIDSSLLGR